MAASDTSTGPAPDQDRPPPWEVLVIGAGFLFAMAVVFWWATSSPSRAGREMVSVARVDPEYALYVGDRACRDCHPGETAHHARSGHARTLRPAARRALARWLDGREAEDPERPGVLWRYCLREGRLVSEHAEGGKREQSPLEYAFGSGRHATTFVSLLDRDPIHPTCLEHRLTYYAHSGALGLTPGQSLAGHASGNTPVGRIHATFNTLKCFGCHTTATSDRGPEVLDEATMIPNVSCERCHGPGRSHVEAARRGAEASELALPFGPGRWTGREQLQLCGECHRLPAMVAPGAIRTDNPVLVRHQPVGLMQSACYTRSRGALSCVTCHDPHARASTDRAAYQATCLSCHQGASQTPCPVSPGSGCLDCHMPRRVVARGMIMTDHWIRILPQLDPRRDRGALSPGADAPPRLQEGHGG